MPDAAHSPEIRRLIAAGSHHSDMNVCFWGATDIFDTQQTSDVCAVRDHFLLLYCRNGYGSMELDGNVYEIEAGQCIVTFPNQAARCFTDSKSPWSIIWVGLSGMLLPFYLQRMGISAANPLFPWRNSEYILHCLMQITASEPSYNSQNILSCAPPQPSTEGELERLSSIYSLLAEAHRLCSSFAELNSQSAEQESYIQKAIAYMSANYNRKIKISDVAKHVGLNRSYLFTLFKEHLTESPQEFLTRLRIKKACDMFHSPESTVASVAYSLGYEPRALTRLFKQITGMTPTEYRKSIDDLFKK